MRRLDRMDSCTLSDALDRLGLSGAITGLAALTTASRRVVGPAVTVELAPDDGRPRRRHLGTATLDHLRPGEVVVVANQGRTEAASWGGLLARAARSRGAAGVIVDGAVRDVDELAELGLPVFARGAVPVSARGRFAEVSSGEPVTIAGHEVIPGDLVVADGSGVCFLPASRLSRVLELAEDLQVREEAMARALEAGALPSRILGRDYERLTVEGNG